MTQIKAEELRIWNYLERNGLMQVTAIHKSKIKIYDHFNKKEHEYFFLASTFKGLPITEELLLKAGFTKTIGFWIKLGEDSFEVSPMDGKWFVYFRNFNKGTLDEFVCLRKDVLYWHTLQNLFYSITGKELTL
jgi:hypothetical protein